MWPAVLNIILKVLCNTMPNEGEENDSGQRDQANKGWHNQVRQGRNQRRQGNRGTDQQRGRQTRFEGREP